MLRFLTISDVKIVKDLNNYSELNPKLAYRLELAGCGISRTWLLMQDQSIY